MAAAAFAAASHGLAIGQPAGAQGWCFVRPHPLPDCKSVFLYEISTFDPFAGTRAKLDTAAHEPRGPFSVGQHVAVEFGVLRNQTRHSSIGASVGAGIGDIERLEAKARYRLWFTAPSGAPFHLDLAAGPVRSTVAVPRSGPAASYSYLEHPPAVGVTTTLDVEAGGLGLGVGAIVRGDALYARGQMLYGATGGINLSAGSALLISPLALLALSVAMSAR